MKRFALVLGTMAVLTAVSGSQLLAQNLPPYSPAGGAVFVSAFPTSSAPVARPPTRRLSRRNTGQAEHQAACRAVQ